MLRFSPLADIAEDEKKYQQLCLLVDNLYSHFASDGKVPLKFMSSSESERELDRQRLKELLGHSWALDDEPQQDVLTGEGRSQLQGRTVAIKWDGPWHLAEVLGPSSEGARFMEYKEVEYEPNFVVKYLEDSKKGDALLTTVSYYSIQCLSVIGTWVLLKQAPLMCDVPPEHVCTAESRRAGTKGRHDIKRKATRHKPGSEKKTAAKSASSTASPSPRKQQKQQET